MSLIDIAKSDFIVGTGTATTIAGGEITVTYSPATMKYVVTGNTTAGTFTINADKPESEFQKVMYEISSKVQQMSLASKFDVSNERKGNAQIRIEDMPPLVGMTAIQQVQHVLRELGREDGLFVGPRCLVTPTKEARAVKGDGFNTLHLYGEDELKEGCINGAILHRLGVPLVELAKTNFANMEIVLKKVRPFLPKEFRRMTEEEATAVARLVTQAQMANDSGAHWGSIAQRLAA